MHIILCSDSSVVKEAVAGRLVADDHRVRLTACESGMELLATVKALAADLVVLDLGTHGLGGLLLISAVQELAPGVPILAVSATADVDARPVVQRGIPHVVLAAEGNGEMRALLAQLTGKVAPSAPPSVDRDALGALHNAA
jgi:CheY-like chemotaxis protein